MRWLVPQTVGGGLAAALVLLWAWRKWRREEPRLPRIVDIYVMLPLNAVEQPVAKLSQQFHALKSAGVKGVMMDFWWSQVEKSPGEYDWSGYLPIVELAKQENLEMQCVMSFHTCGEADGDNYVVKLPRWVLDVTTTTSGLLFQDETGRRSEEYLSFGADLLKVLPGKNGRSSRTPLDVYMDYFKDFRTTFKSYMGSTIVEVQVGVGPCGELRYPAYPLSKWTFPGIGMFQCFDANMLADYEKYMSMRGFQNTSPPSKGLSGTYNSFPEETEFFRSEGIYKSKEAALFQEWYFLRLVEHGDRVLEGARRVFGAEIDLSCKVSGVHWWYHTPSRAAESTSGYYNYNGFDSYGKIAAMLKKHNAVFLFTCMEKTDRDEPPLAMCSPQSLVRETARAAALNGVKYGGENALEFKKWSFYRQIVRNIADCLTLYPDLNIKTLTLLRLDSEMMQDKHLHNLRCFVQNMSGTEQI